MFNPLAKLFSLAKGGLNSGVNSVIGLDLGSSSVKVVQLRKDKGRIILETYGELATGPYGGKAVGQAVTLPADKTTELLTDLFREANVTTKMAALSIPLRASLLVTIEVPDLDQSQLATVVPIEARKYVPVPISEVALDWWVIPHQAPSGLGETPTGKTITEVLVVAIHKTSLKQYETVVRTQGLTTSFFEIETFSAIRSTLANDLAPTVLLDMGSGTTKLAIVDYGVVRVSHTINKGSQDITLAISRSMGVDFAKAEEIKRTVGLVERAGEANIATVVNPVVEFIFAEANRVMLDYQKKHSRPIGKVVLIGGGSLLQGLAAVAKTGFTVPVTFGQPFNKVETPAFLRGVLAEAGPGFAVAIGLALRQLQDL